MTGNATVFAVVFIALWTAHSVGDHWLQTPNQAKTKGGRGLAGRLACARHVTTLTLTKAVVLALVVAALGLHLNPYAILTALLVDALSHYWADRRTTLTALADLLSKHLIPGKDAFVRMGDPMTAPAGTGAYALDQSFHHAFLLIAALIASLGGAA